MRAATAAETFLNLVRPLPWPLALTMCFSLGMASLALADDADAAEDAIEEAVPESTEAEEAIEEATPAPEEARPAARPAPTRERDARDPMRVLGAPTESGASGLHRLPTSMGLHTGYAAFGLHGSYTTGQDLVRRGDEVTRATGSFTFTIQPIDQLEVFGALWTRSVSNTFSNPNLIQSTGNTNLGVRGGEQAIPGLHLGGTFSFFLPAGPERVGVAFDSSVIHLLFLASAEFDQLLDEDVPVRAHFATGPIIDNSRNLFDGELTRPERFGHDVTSYSRWRLGLGVDAPLPWVTPYLEWVLDIPINPPCSNVLTVGCIQDNGFASFPHFINVGIRGTPMVEGLVLHTGMELGMTTAESQGTPAVPAWSWLFGATWAFNALGAEPAEPRPAREVAPATGFIEGIVADEAGGEGLPGVVVSVEDRPWSALVTDEHGRFRTPDLPLDSAVVLTFGRPGYLPFTETTLPDPEGASIEVSLVEDIDGARFSGRVLLEDGAREEITLHIVRPGAREQFTAGEDGRFEQDLTPGTYLLYVTAPGFRTIRERLILEGGRNSRSYELAYLEPGEPQLLPDRLVFEDTIDEIAFDGEDLAPGSEVPVALIAELLDRSSGLRLIVRTHTDDREDETGERALTEARAGAIIEALVEAGVARDRLEADARGAAEPLFPNINERNRARNNRVEFLVVQP